MRKPLGRKSANCTSWSMASIKRRISSSSSSIFTLLGIECMLVSWPVSRVRRPASRETGATAGGDPRIRRRVRGKDFYLANEGSVVKVCATGMRIPRAPIWPPAGVSNSTVPRILAVAGYLSVTRVNARWPLAARFSVSVAS